MPRIEADSIEAHVRQQTDRILTAAGELFRQRGFRGTDMSEIARSIGLARNSLYRYYDSKDHILIACMERDMAPYTEIVECLKEKYPDAIERIQAWIDLQIEMAIGPCHVAMQLVGNSSNVSDQLRQKISEMHLPQRRVLEAAVSELVAETGRDSKLLTTMVESLSHTAAREILSGGDRETITQEMKRAATSILVMEDQS